MRDISTKIKMKASQREEKKKAAHIN